MTVVSASSGPKAFVPPPLTVWGNLWRGLVAVAVGFVAFTLAVGELPSDRLYLIGVDLLFGVAVLVLMWFRRLSPLVVALVATALGSFSALALGAVIIIQVSLATRRQWREVLAVGLIFVGGSFLYRLATASGAEPLWVGWEASGYADGPVYSSEGKEPWWLTGVFGLLVFAIVCATGFYIGARRELLASLQERVVTAEREQSARELQARSEERTRIAREMHDVLAHRISLVAMHSGALAFRTDLSRQETTETAGIIRDNAHLALTELRQVLGVLRGVDDDGVPERPQPTLANFEDLVSQSGRAQVRPRVSVDPGLRAELTRVPETVGRAAYRILQECLTNVRKHAPGEVAAVRIGGAPGDRVTLEVRNACPALSSVGRDGRLPNSGMGLTGLVERASLAGGELSYGRDRAGDFVVRAWLPWQN